MRGAPAPARRERRNHHGRKRAVRLIRELRLALPCRRRHRKGIEPAGGHPGYFPRHVQYRCPDQLRSDQDPARHQDHRIAQRADRRGDQRSLRQAGAVAGGEIGAATPARDRPAGDLPGADRAGCAGDPRVGRARLPVPRRDGQILRVSGCSAEDPGGGDRRRLHRPRDRRKSGASRLRRDPRRNARSTPGAARSGDGGHR